MAFFIIMQLSLLRYVGDLMLADPTITVPSAADMARAAIERKTELVIAVTPGAIEISGTEYADVEAMIGPIREALRVNPKRRVLIEARSDAHWSELKTIMKATAAAGVTDLSFSVVEPSKPANAP